MSAKDRDRLEAGISLGGSSGGGDHGGHAADEDVVIRLRPTILCEGVRTTLRDEMTIGSSERADLRLPPEAASGIHAVLKHLANGTIEVTDVSGVGVLVNGEAIRQESRALRGGDRLTIGGHHIFVASTGDGGATALDAGDSQPLVIGSAATCDITLDHPTVSPVHAVVERRAGGAIVIDHSSRATLLVDGASVGMAALQPGSELGVGPFRLVFDGEGVIVRASGEARLDTLAVTRDVGSHRILQPTTTFIKSGELVAIIGESGAGKTTLLRTMAGIDAPSEGVVLVGGEAVGLHKEEIGYVPQDDIVHMDLTVVEALRYAAELRLPDDAEDSAVEAAVARILDEMELRRHAHTRVGRLSGGQRKRVSVATELLDQPTFLMLDEPTTGLDPGLEERAMEMFKRLTEGDRAVVLVTHATKNLDLCDRLIVMAPGGFLAFAGTPSETCEFFGVAEVDQIYSALADVDPAGWQRRFEARPRRRRERALAELEFMNADGIPHVRGKAGKHGSILRQTSILVSRYVTVLLRDRRNLSLLLVQAPVLGLLSALVYQPGALADADRARDATNLLFLLVTISIWLGAISAAREVVRERALMARETAAGVRVPAYVSSKVLVLFGLALIQVTSLLAVALAFQWPGSNAEGIPGLYLVMVMAAWTAVTLGLAISTVARTENQATSLIPLALLPQLVLGGAVVAVASMSTPMQFIAGMTLTRWFFAGAGTAMEMNSRIASDPAFSRVSEFGDDFFRVPLLAVALIALTMSAILLGAVVGRIAGKNA